MNVAITRAKQFLWVIGNAKALNRDEYWKLVANGSTFNKFVKKSAD